MIICTRKIEFDSAHRLINHEGKCKLIHGHRYVLEASFASAELDEIGRVIDFSIIKDLLGSWINQNFDHNTILSIKDKKLGDEIEKITNQKIYYLADNPTAENIAKHLLEEICPKILIDQHVQCIAIKLYETPNCFVYVEKK
jgi:6-pyruvoyltetrahydropterin/6-carboxytetrahydropterin synthase